MSTATAAVVRRLLHYIPDDRLLEALGHIAGAGGAAVVAANAATPPDSGAAAHAVADANGKPGSRGRRTKLSSMTPDELAAHRDARRREANRKQAERRRMDRAKAAVGPASHELISTDQPDDLYAGEFIDHDHDHADYATAGGDGTD